LEASLNIVSTPSGILARHDHNNKQSFHHYESHRFDANLAQRKEQDNRMESKPISIQILHSERNRLFVE
jgi:hypothetical protein